MVADYRVSATRRWDVEAKTWGIIGAAWTAIVAFVSWYLTGLSLKKEIRKLKEDLSEAIKKSSQQYTIQVPDSGLPNVEFHLEYKDQEVFYHKKKKHLLYVHAAKGQVRLARWTREKH